MNEDFVLRWPRDVFKTELGRLLFVTDGLDSLVRGRNLDSVAVEMLLEEAFVSRAPVEAFNVNANMSLFGNPEVPPEQWLRVLYDQTERLPETASPAPYWSQRRLGRAPSAPMSFDSLKTKWVEFIGELLGRGYLDQRFPSTCVDDSEAVEADQSAELERLIGVPNLWPLSASAPSWDEDMFIDLVEVFHDLVARPTRRHFHSFAGCGWHWSGFEIGPARRLYRAQVNQLLERGAVSYRLADSGEDAGRLVEIAPDDRQALIEAMVDRTDDEGDPIRHAVALFRARHATRQEKRSAAVALAHVLESRRPMLKASLLSGDEGALFQIANQFAIRHQNEQQKSDYDDAFLDWVFWWYLATIELTDRLLAR